MALTATVKDVSFGVGDRVRVVQKIKEGDKEREQAFEGMVIGIKGHGTGKSFTVRRIGAQRVGIERIFPVLTPTISRVEVVKKGLMGVRRGKLYYTRDKSAREVEKIYKRSARREAVKEELKSKTKTKKTTKKKTTSKKTSKSK